MAREDQEHLEDYLALERYIEAYRMALSLHTTSSRAAAPRPEFLTELQAKLTQRQPSWRWLSLRLSCGPRR